jgi:hypothetical protein
MGAAGPGAPDLRDRDVHKSVLLVSRATLAVHFCRTGAKCQKRLHHLNRRNRESRKESKNSSVVVSRATIVLAAIPPAGVLTSSRYLQDHPVRSQAGGLFPDPLLTIRRAVSSPYLLSSARIVGFPCSTTSISWESERNRSNAYSRLSFRSESIARGICCLPDEAESRR